MGLKLLGLLCAGVFIGAALAEVRQIGRGKDRERGQDDDSGGDPAQPPREDGDGAATSAD